MFAWIRNSSGLFILIISFSTVIYSVEKDAKNTVKPNDSVDLVSGNNTNMPSLANKCISCHQSDGNSVNTEMPKIAGLSYEYIVKQLQEFKLGAEGKRNNPVMQAIAVELNEEDMHLLAEYYSSQTMSLSAATNSNIELGEKIYRIGNKVTGVSACAACHSQDGHGNKWAGFPKLSGQNAAYIAAQLHNFKESTRSNDLNSMMRQVASRMTDEEIEAVSNYISGLR